MNAITFSADYFKCITKINLHMLHGFGGQAAKPTVKLSANLRIKPSVNEINWTAVIRLAGGVFQPTPSIFTSLWPSKRCRSINQIMNEFSLPLWPGRHQRSKKKSIFRWFTALGTRPLNINPANAKITLWIFVETETYVASNCHFKWTGVWASISLYDRFIGVGSA